jgi:hypothetical protein
VIETLGPVGTFLSALAAFLIALGAKELITRWVTRRGDRSDAVTADRKQLSVVEAEGNLEVLKILLVETRDRLNGYEGAIQQMRADHLRDITDLKAENRVLERQVSDLRATLQEYQLGNRVPRGMVLLPLREVRRVRERVPGLLDHPWYPGEEDGTAAGAGPGSVDVRLTPLPPAPGAV